MSEVRLVDLEIIKRYSLAIRQETANADELLAALDASRAVVAAAVKTSKGGRASSSRSRASTRAKKEEA